MTTIAETPDVATDAGTLSARADGAALVNAWIAEAEAAGEIEDGVLPDWLAELVTHAEADLRTKAERAGLAARRLAHEQKAIQAELDVLAGRMMKRKREEERIKLYVRTCLEIAGETKIETPLVTVAIQANGGAQPIRWLRPIEELPEAFRRLPDAPWTLNAQAAQSYLKSTGTLPDGFELLPRGSSLRIR